MLISELRKNPSVNKKITMFEYIKSLPSLENIFLSFSNVPKLGINPKSKWKTTPIGIYSYPLWLFNKRDLLQSIEDKRLYFLLEYGFDREFAIFFKYNGSYLDASSYSNEDYKKDVKKLKEFSNIDIDWEYYETNAGTFEDLNNLIQYVGRKLFQTGQYSSTAFWAKTYLLLGYNCIIDNNYRIHGSEKIQSVHFTKKGISNVTVLNNNLFGNSDWDKIYDWKSYFNKIRRLIYSTDENISLTRDDFFFFIQDPNADKVIELLKKHNLLTKLINILEKRSFYDKEKVIDKLKSKNI